MDTKAADKPTQDRFTFDEQAQDLLLACICNHAPAFDDIGPLVLPQFFWGVCATQTCAFMQAYRAEKGEYPTLRMLIIAIKEKLARSNPEQCFRLEKYI